MSHTKVKTTYQVQAAYGSSETMDLYCHHNHSCDTIDFMWKDGSIANMCFESWIPGNDLWDAVNRLWYPFKDKWGEELKDGVEYYHKAPWEE